MIAALFVCALGLAPTLDVDAFLAEARRGGADGSVAYRDPGPWERAVQGAWFAAVFAAVDRPERVALLAPLARLGGLHAEIGEAHGRPVLLVGDPPGRHRGSGAYVVRLGPGGSELVVQAPHSWSDLGSLPIARAIFAAADARILAVNTVHRRGQSGEEELVRGEADVAHRVESTFQSATVAWLKTGRAGVVLQVHGFKDGVDPYDVVISAGDASQRPAWLQAVGTALARFVPPERVAIFPPDVQRLAGLTNVQGQATNAAGARFLHLELGASLRRRLRDGNESFGFSRALVEVLDANCR